MKQIRVLSYNIHKGFNFSNRRFVLEKMRSAIALMQPDVVFLQEVQGEHRNHEATIQGWISGPQCKFLAEGMWPHFVYGQNASYDHGHHGNAILSRFPIVEWSNTDLSTNYFEARGMLHAVLEVPGLKHGGLHCLCVHLNLLKRGRAVQLAEICKKILEAVPAESPLLLGGDFNDWSRKASSVLKKSVGVTEAFQELYGRYASTFPSRFPVLQLDRMYSRHLTPVAGHVLSGLPWSSLSDHAALYAEYTLGDGG